MAYRNKAGQSSVSPIRDMDQLRNFIAYYRRKRDAEPEGFRRRIYDRNYMLILLGVNAALRFSDLRRLTVDKVEFNEISQRDQKTGKENKFRLNGEIHRELKAYIGRQGLKDIDFLFWSRNGVNLSLSRKQGYNIVREAAEGVGIHYQVGTHTLRKTFGYWFYQQYHDVVALQTILHHSSPSITLVYIGMLKDEVAEKREKFRLM